MRIVWGIPTDISVRNIIAPRGGHISNFKIKEKLSGQFTIDNPIWASNRFILMRYLGILLSFLFYRIIFLETTYIPLNLIPTCKKTICIVRDLTILQESGIRGYFYRQGLIRASLIIVNSNFMKNKLSAFLKDDSNIFVLFPDIGDYISIAKRSKSNKVAFVSNDNVFQDKGYEVINKICEMRPDIEINVYGERNAKLKDYTNICFRGYRPFKQISQECRIIIIPSAWEEPFGRVALEALRENMEIVAADIGGLSEILPSEYLIKGDVSEYLSMIDKFLCDDRVTISKLSRLKILDRFKTDYEGLFNQIYNSCSV
jgi:glycosyltransferase involved in cell wall biosynthesis